MNRYLIEVPHDPTHEECARLADSMVHAGAHFITNAEWGCEDGIHTGWLIVEALCDGDARLITPPALRSRAKVTRLNKLAFDEFREMTQPAHFHLQRASA